MASLKHGEKVGEYVSSEPFARTESHDEGEIIENTDHLHRRLGNRQIQLMAIGGTIGTALFVSIGGGLYKGGPASLFLAYTIYACFLGLVNNCIAEMTTAYPVSGGFIRLAGHFVDDAFGYASKSRHCSVAVVCARKHTDLSFDEQIHGWIQLLHLRSLAYSFRNHRPFHSAELLE
jgi:amino acid permease